MTRFDDHIRVLKNVQRFKKVGGEEATVGKTQVSRVRVERESYCCLGICLLFYIYIYKTNAICLMTYAICLLSYAICLYVYIYIYIYKMRSIPLGIAGARDWDDGCIGRIECAGSGSLPGHCERACGECGECRISWGACRIWWITPFRLWWITPFRIWWITPSFLEPWERERQHMESWSDSD